MFAIIYKADGVPVCCQVPGVAPDPVVVWTSEASAKAFIDSQSGGDDFQAIAMSEQSMEQMAKALGCAVEQLSVEQYPG